MLMSSVWIRITLNVVTNLLFACEMKDTKRLIALESHDMEVKLRSSLMELLKNPRKLKVVPVKLKTENSIILLVLLKMQRVHLKETML